MPRSIPKDGKVWRLTPESWETLRLFDSDPNVAIRKMKDINISQVQDIDRLKQAVQQGTGQCGFRIKEMKEAIKEAMEEALIPFTGG